MLVQGVSQVLAWMCGSGSDGEFASVFGLADVEGARERAAKAKAWVETNCSGHSQPIGVDRTRESEEMMIGGHATFGGCITLRHDAFAQAPDTDLIARVTHEVFHAANQDVLDNGGYPGVPEDFKQRSPGEKLVNASHYEEVARRFLGASPVGGDFEPAVRMQRSEDGTMMQIDTRTPLQRATDHVRNAVQIAWERCQNVHGFLKAHVHVKYDSGHLDENQRTQAVEPILYWSEALGLQVHQRLDEAHGQDLAVNYIDLLQVESLTKTLGRMMSADLVQLLESTPIRAQRALGLSDDSFKDLIADSLLRVLVNQHADARWLTPDAFKTMIETLRVAPRDVRNVVT